MGEIPQAAGSLGGLIVFVVLIGAIGYTIWCKKREKAGLGKCFWVKKTKV
jgi:hypothetical protein